MDVSCFPNQDCMFGDWSEWSGCTKLCDGIKRRSRVISMQGRGSGLACEGTLKAVSPCNPGPGEILAKECKKKPPVDCELSEWGPWQVCSHKCGGGTSLRSRDVLKYPDGGGEPCNDYLEQVKPCNPNPCEAGCQPVDCEWGGWTEWGTCDKCDGQRTRFRHVVAQAVCGGLACGKGNAEETTDCPRKCHDVRYCTWDNWETWGACNSKCGVGSRTRKRALKIVRLTGPSAVGQIDAIDNLDDATMQAKLESLMSRTKAMENHRSQELIVAFAVGGVSLIAVLLVFRAAKQAGNARDFEERSFAE
jgi:hypothetical protein